MWIVVCNPHCAFIELRLHNSGDGDFKRLPGDDFNAPRLGLSMRAGLPGKPRHNGAMGHRRLSPLRKSSIWRKGSTRWNLGRGCLMTAARRAGRELQRPRVGLIRNAWRRGSPALPRAEGKTRCGHRHGDWRCCSARCCSARCNSPLHCRLRHAPSPRSRGGTRCPAFTIAILGPRSRSNR